MGKEGISLDLITTLSLSSYTGHPRSDIEAPGILHFSNTLKHSVQVESRE